MISVIGLDCLWGGEDCKPVEATVLPNCSYYLHPGSGCAPNPLTDLCQFDILQSGPGRGRMQLDQLRRHEFITLLGRAYLLDCCGSHPTGRAEVHTGPVKSASEPRKFVMRGKATLRRELVNQAR